MILLAETGDVAELLGGDDFIDKMVSWISKDHLVEVQKTSVATVLNKTQPDAMMSGVGSPKMLGSTAPVTSSISVAPHYIRTATSKTQ